MHIYAATVKFTVQYMTHGQSGRYTKDFSREVVFYVQGDNIPEAHIEIAPYVERFLNDLRKTLRNFYGARYEVAKLELFISQENYL